MDAFTLRLIALVSMLIDHMGYCFYPRLVSHQSYLVMRGVGRLAFPLYCFLLVNGYTHSRDRGRYLTRLCAFAAISQLPFAAAFFTNPFPKPEGLVFSLSQPLFVCLILIGVCCVAWLTTVRRDASVLWPAAALVIAVLRLRFDGFRIFIGDLNVFYTLALGLACLHVLERVRQREGDLVELLMQALGLFCALWLVRGSADYGWHGLLLIAALGLCRADRRLRLAVLLLWCAFHYGLFSGGSAASFFCAAAAAPLVFFYNDRPGPSGLRLAFYCFYPVHLTLLGLFVLHAVYCG